MRWTTGQRARGAQDAPGRAWVTLHVGTPKSGTTSLQRALAHQRAALRAEGVLYPGTRRDHFLEAVALRGTGWWGSGPEEFDEAWAATSAEVAAHRGPTLMSHEVLGGAPVDVVRRVVDAFGGRPVRVVVTCRDLGRQLPAAWQEDLKNGSTRPFGTFLDDELSRWTGAGTDHEGFWRNQNVAGLAARWAEVVGAEHVVLVTVPPRGAPPHLLRERFAEAARIGGALAAAPEEQANPSLGAVEAELLRRTLQELPDDLPWKERRRQVKRRFAEQVLAPHRAGGPLGVPERWHGTVRTVSEEVVAALRAAGHPVVGSLDDLAPDLAPGGADPDALDDGVLLRRALEVLAPMVLRDRPDARGAAG